MVPYASNSLQVNGQVPDSRNLLSRTGQMDFSTVQRRLKMGVYAGKDGVKAFKDDLMQPLRSAFRYSSYLGDPADGSF